MSRWLIAALASMSAFGPIVVAQQNSPRVIYITAERFAFSPSQIKIRAGEEVEFRVTSDDTAHGFHIMETSVSRIVPKRGKGELSIKFRSDRTGRYTFECNRMCGAGHSFMRGIVIVEPSAESDER